MKGNILGYNSLVRVNKHYEHNPPWTKVEKVRQRTRYIAQQQLHKLITPQVTLNFKIGMH